MGKQTLTLTKDNLKEEAKKKAFPKVTLEDFSLAPTIEETHDTIIFTDGQRERYLKGQRPAEEE